VDTGHPSGRELVEAFALPAGTGLILSDASGRVQAFRHAGTLPTRELERLLRKYADPGYVVHTTETVASRPAPAPAPPPPPPAPATAPVPHAPC
jgi:hypothetical protein